MPSELAISHLWYYDTYVTISIKKYIASPCSRTSSRELFSDLFKFHELTYLWTSQELVMELLDNNWYANLCFYRFWISRLCQPIYHPDITFDLLFYPYICHYRNSMEIKRHFYLMSVLSNYILGLNIYFLAARPVTLNSGRLLQILR